MVEFSRPLLSSISVTLTEPMMMRFIGFFFVVFHIFCVSSAWGEWYLDLSAGGGRADLTLESYGELRARQEFEAVTVWRLAVGAGVLYRSGLEIGSELAWSQRGGSITLLAGSIFHRIPTTFEYERSYLDISVAARQRWNLGPMLVSIGAAPRLSLFLEQDPKPYFRTWGPENGVFGIDPELRFSYSLGYAWVRYYWDLTPSYEASMSEVRDRSLFFGVGLRIP